jgi:hypothetical protein
VTGAHGSPPLGSAAREATAPPYHGKRRADACPSCGLNPPAHSGDCGIYQSPLRDFGPLGAYAGGLASWRDELPPDGDPPYPGGMDDREERLRDRDPGADDE